MKSRESKQSVAQRSVVVTGVSGGIGAAIATRLLADGYIVYGTYRGGRVAAESIAEESSRFNLSRVDLANEAEIRRFADGLPAHALHGLVNNAGTIAFEEFNAYDMKLWRDVQRVNVEGPLLLSLHLKDRIAAGGAIVNISSTDAFVGAFDTTGYAASKAALLSLTKSLALNLGPRHIRVNAVAPGWIDTAMGTKMPDRAIEHTPLGRLGAPADVAGVVAFLLSDDSAFISGTTVVADGGYSCLDPVMQAEKLLNANLQS